MKRTLQTLALDLFSAGVVKVAGPDEPGWKLKMHEKDPTLPLSPIYFNLRTPDNPNPGPLTPELLTRIGAVLAELVQPLIFDGLAGVPNAGDPFAEALQRTLDHDYGRFIRMVELIKETRGGERHIVGVRPPTAVVDTVLLVDDLVTAADTKLEAANVLCAADYEVMDCAVLIDREQGGAGVLLQHNVQLHAVYRISELLDLYVRARRITSATRERVQAYLADPRVIAAL